VGEYVDDGPMDLSGSRFGMSSFPSNGYPMKMITGTEGRECKYGLEIEKGVQIVEDKG
jgi:hypothetical protein